MKLGEMVGGGYTQSCGAVTMLKVSGCEIVCMDFMTLRS